MRPLIALPALILLAAAPANGQWEPPDEVLQVRISGKGAWVVRCEFVDRKGKTQTKEARGRGDHLYLLEPVSGTCTYQAAPDQPLALRFKSPLYRCTLPAPEQKMCRQTFVAGSSGQIVIKKRD